MDLGIKGKRALIFGGSKGIGRAVAGALAAEGAEVAVCARKEWAARKVASEAAEKSGVRARGYGIDAWDQASTVTLVDRIVDDFGAIDILFGIARRPVLEDRNALPPGGWETQLDRGFLRCKAVTETVLPGMRERHWGRILWMIPWPAPGTSVEQQLYSVVTAALSAWVESTATDLARDNVAMNLLRPAPVSRTAGTGAASTHRESRQGAIPEPMGETHSIRQVAEVAAFLVSDPASGIFGKTV